MLRNGKFYLLFTFLLVTSCDFVENMMALMCMSCDLPDNTDDWYDTPSLSKLEIEGSPFSIYKFFAWSLYNDSQFMGYTIIDTSQTFTLNGLKKLDFDFLRELPTNDTLKIISLVTAKNRLEVEREPVRTTYHQRSGITIQTEYLEKYNGYSSTRSAAEWFSFSSLAEKRDSVIFYGITRTTIHGEPKPEQGVDSIVLPKQWLYLNLDRKGNTASISAEILIEEQADLYVYKQGTNTKESTINNGFVRMKQSYKLTPTDSMVNTALSEKGFFTEL